MSTDIHDKNLNVLVNYAVEDYLKDFSKRNNFTIESELGKKLKAVANTYFLAKEHDNATVKRCLSNTTLIENNPQLRYKLQYIFKSFPDLKTEFNATWEEYSTLQKKTAMGFFDKTMMRI